MSDETKASATVIHYLRWQGDLTFAQGRPNEVDNLLLAHHFLYQAGEHPPAAQPGSGRHAHGRCVPPADGGGRAAGPVHPDYIPSDAPGGVETPRFREVSLFAFEESSTTRTGRCSLPPCPSCCRTAAYTPPTGAMEHEHCGLADFNMSFAFRRPAQVKAAWYTGAVAWPAQP